MQGSTKTFLIGLFVLITFIILAWVILWLKPAIGDEGLTLRVRFTNVDKINEGTRVNFAGQPVGEVTEIREVKDAREETHDGRVYIYELTLNVDSHLGVYTTDRFTIKTSGLLGERSVEITPVARRGEQTLTPATSEDIIYGCPTGSVEEAFDQIGRLSNSAQGVINKVGGALDKLDENKFWDNLVEAVDHFESLANALDQSDQIKDAIDNLYQFTVDLRNSSENFEGIVKDVSRTTENIGNISELVGKVVGNVSRGEGSVGRLLVKEDLYLETKAVMAKASTLMDDITHYGLLYQNDKKWQRVRAKRANLMAKLCEPEAFKRFFEEEVCAVETALTRLENVIGQCDYSPMEFDCHFKELLRRVESLEEHLKFYTIELQECGECR